MTQPIRNARRRPQMSPSLPPTSISAAITSEYRVMMPWIVVTSVSKSETSCEIETFMTAASSTIRNWASERITSGRQFVTAPTLLAEDEDDEHGRRRHDL